MNTIYRGITILLGSAVTGEKRQLPEDFTLESALPIIKKQNLVSLAFQGALNCGISPKEPVMQRLMQQYLLYLVRSEKQMLAVQQLFDAFEENGIDYLPLKGCQMKQLYPKPELRVMGDADILIRAGQYSQAEQWMRDLGFTMTHEGENDHEWRREDLMVELHWNLFPPIVQTFDRYFGNGWSRAIKENGFRYRFSPEDTFLYLFTHMAKHYQNSGIGSRHILDLYVYLRANPALDEVYVEAELEKLRLLKFYRNIRRVLNVWFEDGTPDEITGYITDYIFSGGSWGSQANALHTMAIRKSLEKGEVRNSRWRIIFQMVFLPAKNMEKKYPILRKAPWLLPAVWVIRWVEVICLRSRNIRKRITVAAEVTDEKVLARQRALNYVGLDFEYNAE